jgi:hypothetical protein
MRMFIPVAVGFGRVFVFNSLQAKTEKIICNYESLTFATIIRCVECGQVSLIKPFQKLQPVFTGYIKDEQHYDQVLLPEQNIRFGSRLPVCAG